MSRTNRDYPSSLAGESWAAKYGRDGQFSSDISVGHRQGSYYSHSWCSRITSEPRAKRKASKMRRAFEHRDTRAQLRNAGASTLHSNSSVV